MSAAAKARGGGAPPTKACSTKREMGFGVTRTCAECPWRKDVDVGRFPPERFDALRNTVGAGDGFRPIFACHKSPDSAPQACAGYLLVEGDSNLNVRMGASRAGLQRGDVTATGPLYESFNAMAEANGCEPVSSLTHEDLKLIRMRAWMNGEDPNEAERMALRVAGRRKPESKAVSK